MPSLSEREANRTAGQSVCAFLATMFPRHGVDAETWIAWAAELDAIGVPKGPAVEAVRTALILNPREFLPSLPVILGIVRQKRDWLQQLDKPSPFISWPSREEAKSLAARWGAEARRVIGMAGRSTTIPRGWEYCDYLELRARRRLAGIPCGRVKWGDIGFPAEKERDPNAGMAALQKWLDALPLTPEQEALDRQLVADIEARRRARNAEAF